MGKKGTEVLQLRGDTAGLVACLPMGKGSSQATTTHSAHQAPTLVGRAAPEWVLIQGLGAGALPTRALPQSSELSLSQGARTDTRNPIWPSCLPCRRITWTHPVSSPPPPPCPGPHATASWRALSRCLLVPRDWARQARRGEGSEARELRGRLCLWQYLGEGQPAAGIG